MRRFRGGWPVSILCLGAIGWGLWPCGAADPPAPPKDVAGRLTLRSVQVDPTERMLIATGWVNQSQGLVEFLACGPQGKTHESVLALPVSPVDLKAGLLLLDATEVGAAANGQPPVDGRVQLDIDVAWRQDGRTRTVRADECLVLAGGETPVRETGWQFTGSATVNGEFMALADESLIATYWDAWSVVNMPTNANPGRSDIWVNTNVVPPVATPVTLTIRVR